jgi:hypothetical protein
MTINFRQARQYLEGFDFKKLFVEELGWARSSSKPVPIEVDGATYRLTPIAELGGMVVYLCEAQADGKLPAANLRKKIDKRVAELSFEHIVIFVDQVRTKAVWLWVKREAGKASKAREHTYAQGQPGDSLLQKLTGIAFSLDDLDDEGRASISDVTAKVSKAFDLERVTKRFYDEFKDEHAAFLKFVKGVDSADDRAWYTSVMLDRLMFIYFIQKKGFLDSDPDYLPHRLAASKQAGRDRFYRHFLAPLFFEGFAREEAERSPDTRQLLGRIPYLNGGLFLPHQMEQRYGAAIQIPDVVFERLFAFFDRYTWHLDDRPLRADNEINPDVLGYIFEKYINQKEMGAYYTKEDITGYNCRNTILPFLFDKLGTLRYDAVHPLPLKDVEPYIYPAVKQADPLPTETEREHAARQKRLAQIHADFRAGKMASINDLIRYNLDIERFAQDWLRGLADPLTLRAFYFECLTKLTVLDPTVGSGAFLFAAMNILEPLYEICLDKMAELGGPKYPDFKAELARVAAHPNRRYFIFKNIIVNNLYGVDIMDEATEICKLRLFLKLVAQVGDARKIEPLPDIDFNIRAGNTLVGYASLAEVEQAAQRSLFNINLPQQIREADIALRAFRELQTRVGISARELAKAKADTQAKLTEVEGALNEALRNEYGARSLAKFVESHRPFHWYVEFNTIMQDGGFDVIVGNPPYIVYSPAKVGYSLEPQGYSTLQAQNLYAFVFERSMSLAKPTAPIALIVQLTVLSSERISGLQNLLMDRGSFIAMSFPRRPESVFDGVEMPVAIVISTPGDRKEFITSSVQRFYTEERGHALACASFVKHSIRLDGHRIAKIGSDLEKSVYRKIEAHGTTLESLSTGNSKWLLYYQEACRYWVKANDGLPFFKRDGERITPPHGRVIYFANKKASSFAACLANSTLFYWFYSVFSDCEHINDSLIRGFHIPANWQDTDWTELSSRLMDSLSETAKRKTISTKEGHTIVYDEMNAPHSKPIIDEIDRVLARHYGFTDEELDFIINYDIKYRMGKDEEKDEGQKR